jgi:hypothetical protein
MSLRIEMLALLPPGNSSIKNTTGYYRQIKPVNCRTCSENIKEIIAVGAVRKTPQAGVACEGSLKAFNLGDGL